MNTPNDFFDYDGAIEDLRLMYERGRRWIADNLKSQDIRVVYDHTLQITYTLMAFRELAAAQEAL